MPIHNTSRCIVTHFSILSLHNNQTTFIYLVQINIQFTMHILSTCSCVHSQTYSHSDGVSTKQTLTRKL